jgi:hypothetical protein
MSKDEFDAKFPDDLYFQLLELFDECPVSGSVAAENIYSEKDIRAWLTDMWREFGKK